LNAISYLSKYGTLVPVTNSLAGTAAWEYALCYPAQCHPDANVFQQLEPETGSTTPVAHVNASCPQTVCTPVNEDAEIVKVEREPWKSSCSITQKLGTTPNKGHQNN
jgi:hypothetical protein